MADRQEQDENQSNQTDSTQEENNGIAKPSFANGQLSFIGQDIAFIPKDLIQEYCNITKRLDLSFNKILSTDGLEHFKFLRELILDNNDLDDDVMFPHLKELHTLTLNKNKLTNLNSLIDKLAAKLPNLTYLSLLGNEACPNQLSSSDKDEEDYQRYRYYVLYKLPKLKFLDSTTVSAKEIAESKRVGPFMVVVRPHDSDVEEPVSSASSESPQYTPLPSDLSQTKERDHQGTFGKSKYMYYGRHSEGNRFIRNKDL